MSDIPPPSSEPLLVAWGAGDERGIIRALRDGADPNTALNGIPLLVAAAALGREEIVRAVLEAGGNVDVRQEGTRWTALMVATATDVAGSARIRDELLDRGADVNARDTQGNTALDNLIPLVDVRPRFALAHADVLRSHGGVGRQATLVRLDRLRSTERDR